MFQLLMVVIAIGLAAIVVAGGVNYFSSSTGVRLQTNGEITSHFDGLALSINAYRTANNGVNPTDIEQLKGFLPNGEVPRLSIEGNQFNWSIFNDKSAVTPRTTVCLYSDAADQETTAVLNGIAIFTASVGRTKPAINVEVGATCEDTTEVINVSEISGQTLALARANNKLAIKFRGL